MTLLEKLFDIIERFGREGLVLHTPGNLAFNVNADGITSPKSQNLGDTATSFRKGNDDYWSMLNKPEISALILRESLYNGRYKNLRTAIEGSDYGQYLHFVFQSPAEAIDSLTSLQRFEQQKRKIELSDAPEEVIRELEPILVEPDLNVKKKRVTLYLLSRYRNTD